MSCVRGCRDLVSLSGVVIALAGVSGCVSLGHPTEVALTLYTAARDHNVSAGTKFARPGAYDVIAAWAEAAPSLEGCEPDIGGGIRCTFETGVCNSDSEGVLTMHLEASASKTYRVTAAAIEGIVLTFDDPDYGTFIRLAPCGLSPLVFPEQVRPILTALLTGELSSESLVPWPYASPPRTRADTALAMSRLNTNRADTRATIAALKDALGLGADTITVATNAVVEAAASMKLHITPPHDIDPAQSARRFVWRRDFSAYSGDTVLLRRGLELIDFASDIANSRTGWKDALVLTLRGHALVSARTPSIAAIGELSGMVQYLLGRSYLQRATASPTCDLFLNAYQLLRRGYGDLKDVPPTDEADTVDSRAAASANRLLARADSGRQRVCASKGTDPQ